PETESGRCRSRRAATRGRRRQDRRAFTTKDTKEHEGPSGTTRIELRPPFGPSIMACDGLPPGHEVAGPLHARSREYEREASPIRTEPSSLSNSRLLAWSAAVGGDSPASDRRHTIRIAFVALRALRG